MSGGINAKRGGGRCRCPRIFAPSIIIRLPELGSGEKRRQKMIKLFSNISTGFRIIVLLKERDICFENWNVSWKLGYRE